MGSAGVEYFPTISATAGKGIFPIHEIPDSLTIDEVVDHFINVAREAKDDDPFHVIHLDEIEKLYELWTASLPRVEPFYAVKVNDDPLMLKLLARLGASFDCASKDEIQRVFAMGVSPDRIIYAHPCKHLSQLRWAADKNISLTTVDNEDEIYKIKKHAPSMKLVLRIYADDPSADYRMGVKFGCDLEEGKRLVKLANDQGMDVVGVSFHVGSGCKSPRAFQGAIANAKAVFDFASDVCGLKLTLLDIGGGFPGSANCLTNFPQFCKSIEQSLDEHFPASSDVRIIAEPGRYFAMKPYSLCTSIIGKRVTPEEGYRPMYYINDGKYGSFADYVSEGRKDGFRVWRAVNFERDGEPGELSSVWGPTLCGTDCVFSDVVLPELQTGDYLIFEEMGAYTWGLATCFNGFPKPRLIYTARSGFLNRVDL